MKVWPSLVAADERLAERPWRSLAPGRARARSLVEICGVVLRDHEDSAAEALVDALASIALAMQRSFPENIFGDLELLAASLWKRASHEAEGAAASLERQGRQLVALHELFGKHTSIRFRYVHDFIYGFDWAKWVAREPASRAGVGPFDPEFVDYMEYRGHELLALIATGRDRKYPALESGRPRNPFGFTREPAAEIVLHQSLAAAGSLPVEAWRFEAKPSWDRPYAALRREAAGELGLVDAEGSSLRGSIGPA